MKRKNDILNTHNTNNIKCDNNASGDNSNNITHNMTNNNNNNNSNNLSTSF